MAKSVWMIIQTHLTHKGSSFCGTSSLSFCKYLQPPFLEGTIDFFAEPSCSYSISIASSPALSRTGLEPIPGTAIESVLMSRRFSSHCWPVVYSSKACTTTAETRLC